MPRRSGKAASRKARQQRRSKRPTTPGPVAPRSQAASPTPTASPGASSVTSSAPASPNPRPFATGGAAAAGTSRLGEAARAEYHYVGRDLRNTAILVVLMAALLGVAVVVVNLAGIGPS
jgi:hypothetical protein